MDSSDDEAEVGPQSVSNYHFVDDEDEPISFSTLPFQWSEKEGVDEKNKFQIFLHGSADRGLRTIHVGVVAWKFDLLNANPEISVLTKDKKWIKLQKPRKSFEEMIRTELIAVHCFHYARRNPEASKKSVWDYLAKVFSLYDVKPSQNDLVDQMDLISEAVKRDESLSKSKFLLSFLEEKPRKRKLSDEDIQATNTSGFIVDDIDVDDEILEDAEEDESSGDGLFDSVCTFCDNGGDLICCDGCCMRSFHASVEAGSDSMCVSLGMTKREVDATETYICKNCEYKQHQCFACGELGSSDKSSGAQVFRCANATCSYFYHPHCIAKLLYQQDGNAAKVLEKKIVAGEDSFTCPIHKCCVCKQAENKEMKDLQFAVCRRCPTSYHRKCLPSDIFIEKITKEGEENEEEEEEEREIRGWENLLPNRVLIYCLEHEIDDKIGTPIRDIKFPNVEEKKKTTQISELPGSSGKVLSKKRRLTSEVYRSKDAVVKKFKESSSDVKKVINIKGSEKISSGSNLSRKVKERNAPNKSFKGNMKSSSIDVGRPVTTNVKKASLGDQLFTLTNDRLQLGGNQDMNRSELNKSLTVKKTSAMKLSSEPPSLDAETKRRLLALMEESASLITIEDIRKKHEVPSTHSQSLKQFVEKRISAGKVEIAVEAVRAALKKLEDGYSKEDAKAVCEPDYLNEVFRWKDKLKVYLSPFLHGMRYTSFGRHFTKVEKLKEIVNMLHWYVEDGDMVVDFCCGANDFSCLMKEKLEQTGKKCLYKNFDVIHPKNDFNFEKRDWMTVRPHELPKEGSQLIMGLNPPFGLKASLANKFINKALQFKPKLLILIVPPETERLDEKKDSPYNLVWEDDQLVSGRSFYLPGSIDGDNKIIENWNAIAPPVYLWSRSDWHGKHLAIAQRHDHLSRQQRVSSVKEIIHEVDTYDAPLKVDSLNTNASQPIDDFHVRNKESNHNISGNQSGEECFSRDNANRKSQDSHGHERSQSETGRNRKQHGKDKTGIATTEKLPENRQNSEMPPRSDDSYKELPHYSPPNMVASRSSQEGPPFRSFEMPPHPEMGESSFPDMDTSIFNPHLPYGRAYNGAMNGDEYSHGVGGLSHSNLEGGGFGYRSYTPELREPELRSQIPQYGQYPDSSVQRSYMGSQDSGYSHMRPQPPVPYGHMGAAPEPPHMMNMSTMQRYAPRLDELNHTMIDNFGPDPSMMNRNDMYDPRLHRPPQPQPSYQVDSMNFAPGPHHQYSYQNSAGWLNE